MWRYCWLLWFTRFDFDYLLCYIVTITIIRLYFLSLSLLQIRIVDNMIYLCSVIVTGSAVFLFMVLTSNVSRTIKQVKRFNNISLINIKINKKFIFHFVGFFRVENRNNYKLTYGSMCNGSKNWEASKWLFFSSIIQLFLSLIFNALKFVYFS